MQSKRCPKCGVVKPVSGFNKKLAARDGLQSICRECSNAYSRAYHEAHGEEQRAYHRTRYETRRDEICDQKRAYYEAHWEERNAYNRAYYEAHREERNAQIWKRKTEAWKASREVTTRNGEPWTPAEDHVVLTSEGTYLEIAIELGRTTDSVHDRRKLLRRKAVTA